MTFRKLVLFPSAGEKAVSFSSDREQAFYWIQTLEAKYM
jgi:hypothetical protein